MTGRFLVTLLLSGLIFGFAGNVRGDNVETAVFLNVVDRPLDEAASFFSQLIGYDLRIGRDVPRDANQRTIARVTVSSVKAMTLRQVIDELDRELARNGLAAVKRDNGWLIVPVVIRAPVLSGSSPAIVASSTHKTRITSMVFSNKTRAEGLAKKLRAAQLANGIADLSQPDDPAYAVVIEIDDTAAARKDLLTKLMAQGLDQLVPLAIGN